MKLIELYYTQNHSRNTKNEIHEKLIPILFKDGNYGYTVETSNLISGIVETIEEKYIHYNLGNKPLDTCENKTRSPEGQIILLGFENNNFLQNQYINNIKKVLKTVCDKIDVMNE